MKFQWHVTYLLRQQWSTDGGVRRTIDSSGDVSEAVAAATWLVQTADVLLLILSFDLKKHNTEKNRIQTWGFIWIRVQIRIRIHTRICIFKGSGRIKCGLALFGIRSDLFFFFFTFLFNKKKENILTNNMITASHQWLYGRILIYLLIFIYFVQ